MKRKEVNLSTSAIKKLQEKADKDGRKLKNYMEKVLTEKAFENESE